jgi:tRNA-dihydrouridine synthase
MDSFNKGFWAKLKPPIMAMAPMANVTDAAFRRMFVECGRPDVFWTEFVSVEGLLSKGRDRLLPDLWYSKEEHPIVAQIFGSKPEQFEKVGALIKDLGFDGIDINMGCPDRGVEKSGAGANLIKNPELAKQIIRALKKTAGDLPISVKTRIGYDRDQLNEWVPALLEEGLAALTIHLRTRNEMSDVAAHWDVAPKIAALRDKYSPDTLLLGNGDVDSLEDAHLKVKTNGFDGVMVGRGIFGNPWFFAGGGKIPTVEERLARLVKHTELFEQLYKSDQPEKISEALPNSRIKNFDVMKKHYKSYTTSFGSLGGFDGAKELRIKLMETNNAAEVRQVIEKFAKKPVQMPNL